MEHPVALTGYGFDFGAASALRSLSRWSRPRVSRSTHSSLVKLTSPELYVSSTAAKRYIEWFGPSPEWKPSGREGLLPGAVALYKFRM